jgi:D-alanine-D-alanine ligase
MPRKLRVGILYGGRSGEHEVSLLSAASVLKAIDPKRYEIVPIAITKQGRWLTSKAAQALLSGQELSSRPQRSEVEGPGQTLSSRLERSEVEGPGQTLSSRPEQSEVEGPAVAPISGPTSLTTNEIQPTALASSLHVDVIFPILHGTFGEDGTIQGLFELADIAYVGSGVLGSAAGMDKDVMKRLFLAAKLPTPRHLSFLRSEWKAEPKKIARQIEAALKYPLFIKPANLGSSVGISKAHDRKELAPALDLAAQYDRKIVVEQGIGGSAKNPHGKARELEVAVLGNDNPQASVVGEIVPAKEFYDYEAKYHSEDSIPIIPAKLTAAQSKQVRQMAIEAFRACDCAGLARVDFLMEPNSKSTRPPRIYINELNTLPGFTKISMYPKLWEASGLPYPKLIDRLIELALERRQEKDQTTFTR